MFYCTSSNDLISYIYTIANKANSYQKKNVLPSFGGVGYQVDSAVGQFEQQACMSPSLSQDHMEKVG